MAQAGRRGHGPRQCVPRGETVEALPRRPKRPETVHAEDPEHPAEVLHLHDQAQLATGLVEAAQQEAPTAWAPRARRPPAAAPVGPVARPRGRLRGRRRAWLSARRRCRHRSQLCRDTYQSCSIGLRVDTCTVSAVSPVRAGAQCGKHGNAGRKRPIRAAIGSCDEPAHQPRHQPLPTARCPAGCPCACAGSGAPFTAGARSLGSASAQWGGAPGGTRARGFRRVKLGPARLPVALPRRLHAPVLPDTDRSRGPPQCTR
jgi:hypothetical protein